MKNFYSSKNRTYIVPILAILTISMTFMLGDTTDAFALAQLRITADVDGILPNDAELLVTDNGPNDLNGAIGRIVVVTGPLGCLEGTVDSSLSKPVQGNIMMPTIDLSWQVDTSMGEGPCHMSVEFTDTDFTAAAITLTTGVGGTTEGQVMYDAFLDPSNVAFGHAQIIFSDTYDPAPLFVYGSQGSQSLNPVGTYSLSLLVTIWHDGDEVSSGDAFLEGSPEEGEREIVKTSDCPDTFGIYSPEPVQCKFTITYTNTDSNSPPVRILDTLHAEFQVVGTNANTGVVTLIQTQDGSGTTIQWDLDAGTTSATLIVDIETVENPGKGHGKKQTIVFKPTSCGPLPINDGATAFELDPTTGLIVLDSNLEPVVIVGPSDAIIAQAVTGTKDCEVPHTIKRLTITQGATGELILDWRDNGDAELLGYNIYQSICPVSPTILATIPISPSSFTDSLLTPGTEYCYIVTAFNSEGESTDSKKYSQSVSEFAP